MSERKVVPDFSEGDVLCPVCGRCFHLYFNGGELDEDECCGLSFRTEATGYQLVIEPIPESK